MAFPGLKGIEESFELFCAEGIELGVQSFSLLAHHAFAQIADDTFLRQRRGAVHLLRGRAGVTKQAPAPFKKQIPKFDYDPALRRCKSRFFQTAQSNEAQHTCPLEHHAGREWNGWRLRCHHSIVVRSQPDSGIVKNAFRHGQLLIQKITVQQPAKSFGKSL